MWPISRGTKLETNLVQKKVTYFPDKCSPSSGIILRAALTMPCMYGEVSSPISSIMSHLMVVIAFNDAPTRVSSAATSTFIPPSTTPLKSSCTADRSTLSRYSSVTAFMTVSAKPSVVVAQYSPVFTTAHTTRCTVSSIAQSGGCDGSTGCLMSGSFSCTFLAYSFKRLLHTFCSSWCSTALMFRADARLYCRLSMRKSSFDELKTRVSAVPEGWTVHVSAASIFCMPSSSDLSSSAT
mmetsp:Transcript_10350/g.23081  ORF Transcript_10350/g.23081 Transcript_10350/m.23081 type:complete len:238 (-) Transcript_10350:1234-1947(-)